jgi:hypothetical protein
MSDGQAVRGFYPPDHVRLSAADAELQADAWRNHAPPAGTFEQMVDEFVAEHPGTCLQAAEWVYFRSPDWTWGALCGRAGWMLWDPSTGEQFAFRLTVMS